MKSMIIMWIGSLITLSGVVSADTVEAIFDNKCAMCHIKTKPIDMTKLIAPSIMGVMRHVKMTYPNKEDAIKFMLSYVLEPSKDKAVCMSQKIQRFGLMPSQKENVTKEELEKINSWLFDNFPPAGFRDNGRGMSTSTGTIQKKNSSPFLILGKMPHLTKMIMKNWNNNLLALSDVQKAQLRKIRKETISRIAKLKKEIFPLEGEVAKATMSGEKPESLRIRVEKLSKLKAEATMLHIKCIYNTKNILSSEQLKYLALCTPVL